MKTSCIVAIALALVAEARFQQRSPLYRRQANFGSLGSCTDPTIRFGAGIDGRKETAFIPNDTNEFAHNSAQAPGIITQFICDTFTNKCGADQTAKDTCTQAKAKADALGKVGAAADVFNAAFGKTTNFAAIQALDDQGKPVGGTGTAAASQPAANNGAQGQVAQVTVTATAEIDCGSAQSTQAAQTTPAVQSMSTAQVAQTTSAAQGGNAAASGINVQKFTAGLGGATPPPVIQGSGDRPFSVDGSTFVNAAAALQRSCSVQHNACANLANSGGGFAVSACDAQEGQCNAAA